MPTLLPSVWRCVAVVPGADFAAPHHVRISYTVPPDRLGGRWRA
ncbi:hypothetical protein AB0D45_06885 [Streptomyces sp. NPDC048352]